MKEEYFSPQAEILAFNYASVVSASLDTPTVPTSPSSDTGFPGQGGGNGHGGGHNKTIKKKYGCR